MRNFTKLAPLAAAVLLAGCRIDIAVPTGGSVTTSSGNYACGEGQSCQVEANDTAFNETFIATPQAEYLFAGWEKGERRLCGGSLEPCVLDASLAADNAALTVVLESDEAFNLLPQFLPADELRVYQVGELVRFSGTLEERNGWSEGDASAVSARLEFLEPVQTLAGKPVIAARLVVSDSDNGEVYDQTVHFWQETGGEVFQLTDTYGNILLNNATNDEGVISIPVPLEPFHAEEVPFSAMWSGHTSTPLTSGSRSLEVGEPAVVSLLKGDFLAYPVVISDEQTYLVTYDEFKRDQVVKSDWILWVSQPRGVIKMEVERQVYSDSGALLTTRRLELEMIGSNF